MSVNPHAVELGLTTQEYLDVLTRSRHMPLNHILRDKSNTTFPSLLRLLVEDIVDSELLGMFLGQLVQLFLEQDVVKCDIGIDERKLRLVVWVLEHGSDDLEHRRDAGTACKHTDVRAQSGPVVELALGSFDADMVANRQERHVPGDVSLFICLDHEVKVTEIIIRRCRRIRTHDALAINICLHRDVLSNGQTKYVVGVGQTEAVTADIVRLDHKQTAVHTWRYCETRPFF